MAEHPTDVSNWNDETLDRLRTSPEGTHWVLEGPIGTGKMRVIAQAARAWRAFEPTRTLIIGTRNLAANLAEQIGAHAQLRWLSKKSLRDSPDLAFDAPEDLLAATSPGILTDGWAVDVLSNVSWDNVIVDLDAAHSDAIEPLALLTSRHPAARVVGFRSSPTSEEIASRLGLTPLRFGTTLGPEHFRPAQWAEDRFHAVLFERSEPEQALLTAVDEAVAEAGSLARRLGLLSVQAAAASSFYAMQASALVELERLRATRNVLVHEGLAADAPSTSEVAIEAATLVRAFARLEWIAAQVDELEFDSRQNALLQLVLEPAIVDRVGSTVVFCARTTTAEYVDHGLRLLGLESTTLTQLRDREVPLERWLDRHGTILVVTDPELMGLDLTGARQVINYDLPTTPEGLAVRSTRIRWTADAWDAWTLLPSQDQLTEQERTALVWGPYLAANPRFVQ
jgi:hypothetical protein